MQTMPSDAQPLPLNPVELAAANKKNESAACLLSIIQPNNSNLNYKNGIIAHP